ncbi:MAG TPA: lmo0937 family membrane protein [Polyangia bacterium]|nr:lmo0937 family membrane protein [Polyangia bacterium]
MLETIIVLMVLLWAFGFWGPYHANLGPFIHVLLLIAVVVLVIRLIQGRRVV